MAKWPGMCGLWGRDGVTGITVPGASRTHAQMPVLEKDKSASVNVLDGERVEVVRGVRTRFM